MGPDRTNREKTRMDGCMHGGGWKKEDVRRRKDGLGMEPESANLCK